MNAPSKSNQWLLEQAVTIGSTAAGVVTGESPYQTPAEFWPIMREAMLGQAPQGLTANDDMRRGLLTESLHRDLLEAETGMAIIDHDQNEFLYNKDMPWAHALPDGWIDWHGQTIPVQLKCPRARRGASGAGRCSSRTCPLAMAFCFNICAAIPRRCICSSDAPAICSTNPD